MSRNVLIDGRTLEGVTAIKAKNAEGDDYFSFDDTSDATAEAVDIAAGKTAYVNGVKLTGTNTGVEENDLDGLVDGSMTDFTMPSGKTKISSYRFYQFSSLLTANLGAAQTIGDRAFYECKAIKTMELPASLTSIGSYAFYYAASSGGAALVLEPTETCTVGTYAFQYSRINNVSGAYSSIGDYAFASCSYLTEISISECTSLGTYAFYNDTALTTLDIAVSGSLGNYSFYSCTKVASANVENCAITSLGSYAFSRFGSNRTNSSTNILTLDLRNSKFSSIPAYAFGGDSSSTSYRNKYMKVMLPSSVSTIADNSFRYVDYCEFYFTGSKPPTLSGTAAWQNATNYKILVPYASINAYRTATNWTAQEDYICGYAPANTFTVGATLPEMNAEGYALTWYSDIDLTTPVTEVEDASAVYFCVAGTEKIGYDITSIAAINCDIIVSDGTKTYSAGDGVLVDTVLTITAVPTVDGYIPYTFTVNGVEFESGGTITVDGDISVTAIYYDGENIPISPVFGDNSWLLIKEAFKSGVAASLFSVGDTKEVTLLDGNTYHIRIADMTAGRYNLSDGTGTTNGVFEFVECLPTSYAINSSSKEGYWTGGGWAECDMNNTVLGSTVWDLLPDDMKEAISEITLNEYSYTSPSPREATSKLFLPAETEIFSTRHYSAEGYQTDCEAYEQWQYYAAITTADGSTCTDRQKAKVNTTTSVVWWLRSACSGYYDSFCTVGGNGGYYSYNAYNTYGVSPCFAI